MNGHTPGPWTLGALVTPQGYFAFDVDAHDQHSNLTRTVAIAEHWARETAEANARLIAEAPALAELAEAFVSYLEDDSRSLRRRNACLQSALEIFARINKGIGQ